MLLLYSGWKGLLPIGLRDSHCVLCNARLKYRYDCDANPSIRLALFCLLFSILLSPSSNPNPIMSFHISSSAVFLLTGNICRMALSGVQAPLCLFFPICELLSQFVPCEISFRVNYFPPSLIENQENTNSVVCTTRKRKEENGTVWKTTVKCSSVRWVFNSIRLSLTLSWKGFCFVLLLPKILNQGIAAEQGYLSQRNKIKYRRLHQPFLIRCHLSAWKDGHQNANSVGHHKVALSKIGMRMGDWRYRRNTDMILWRGGWSD